MPVLHSRTPKADIESNTQCFLAVCATGTRREIDKGIFLTLELGLRVAGGNEKKHQDLGLAMTRNNLRERRGEAMKVKARRYQCKTETRRRDLA